MKEGEWEVGKGEGDAYGAGGDYVHAVTTIVGKGGAKIVGAVPVMAPRKTVVRAVKRKTGRGDEGGGRRSRKEDGADRTRQRGKGRGAKGA